MTDDVGDWFAPLSDSNPVPPGIDAIRARSRARRRRRRRNRATSGIAIVLCLGAIGVVATRSHDPGPSRADTTLFAGTHNSGRVATDTTTTTTTTTTRPDVAKISIPPGQKPVASHDGRIAGFVDAKAEANGNYPLLPLKAGGHEVRGLPVHDGSGRLVGYFLISLGFVDLHTATDPTALDRLYVASDRRSSQPNAGVLRDVLMAFVADPTDGTFADLPLPATDHGQGTVRLGLGGSRGKAVPVASLRNPSGWLVRTPPSGFRGTDGSVSAFDELARVPTNVVAGTGTPRACANKPAQPRADAAADETLVWFEPDPATYDTCSSWFLVTVTLDSGGTIQAINLDLWEP
jgi:hypothetical protein